MQNSKILSVFFIILFLLSSISLELFLDGKAQEATDAETVFGMTYLSTNWHYELGHLPDATLDRDFELFSGNGIKSITLSAIWTYLEPSYQNYNFPALDEMKRVCEFAAKYNISVVIDFHTIMQPTPGTDYSWTMPSWFSPRLFNTVFTNATIRQAWLDFLGNSTNYLKDVSNLDSWQMMNEPFRGDWACNASIDEFVQLWNEMKTTITLSSDKPISIRFAEYGFRSPTQFNWDPQIYGVCDYVSLNYYEAENSNPQNLTASITEIRNHGKNVVISEFGIQTNDDSVQLEKTSEIVVLFKALNVSLATAFFWRADYDSSNPSPPGHDLNLAKTTAGDPRAAFYEFSTLPVASSTASPTVAPLPTLTATPTPTPFLTATASPTLTSTPAATHRPTPVPTSHPTPNPTISPTPSSTAIPTPSQGLGNSQDPEPSSEFQPKVLLYSLIVSVIAFLILTLVAYIALKRR